MRICLQCGEYLEGDNPNFCSSECEDNYEAEVFGGQEDLPSIIDEDNDIPF